MDIYTIIQESLERAASLPDEGKELREIHRNRSKNLVEALASAFRSGLVSQPTVRVLGGPLHRGGGARAALRAGEPPAGGPETGDRHAVRAGEEHQRDRADDEPERRGDQTAPVSSGPDDANVGE